MNTKLFIFTGLVGCLTALGTVACGDSGSTGSGGGSTGGSSTGGSTTTGTAGGGTGGAAAAATCATYCTTIMGACSGANAQYTSMDGCLAECAAFDQGAIQATSGDSLECRAYHAGVAATADATIHCVHAGPLGSGAGAAGAGCTTDNLTRCTAYCAVNAQVCTGANAAYASEDECRTACATADDSLDFNTGVTSVSGTAGADVGELECRTYHMSVASQDAGSATTHCPHTNFDNTTQCHIP